VINGGGIFVFEGIVWQRAGGCRVSLPADTNIKEYLSQEISFFLRSHSPALLLALSKERFKDHIEAKSA
jgi:hypothetical protein